MYQLGRINSKRDILIIRFAVCTFVALLFAPAFAITFLSFGRSTTKNSLLVKIIIINIWCRLVNCFSAGFSTESTEQDHLIRLNHFARSHHEPRNGTERNLDPKVFKSLLIIAEQGKKFSSSLCKLLKLDYLSFNNYNSAIRRKRFCSRALSRVPSRCSLKKVSQFHNFTFLLEGNYRQFI